MGLFSKSKSVIGIDVGSSSVKIVQLRKKGGVAVLETYGSLAIGPYADTETDIGKHVNTTEEIIQTVIDVLRKEAKITSKSGGISIPFSVSLISLIKVPALSDERIAQTIPFEARKHIPVPLEEVSLDWFIVPAGLLEPEESPIVTTEELQTPTIEKENSRRVLLIAIHNTELKKYKSVSSSLDLDVKFFEIEIFSTLRSVVFENRYPILIIDIGASTTKFYVLEHNIILRSFFINQGGETMTNAVALSENISFKDAEKKKRQFGLNLPDEGSKKGVSLLIEEVFSQANLAITDFESKNKNSIGKVILSGGGSSMKGLVEAASERLKVKVETADPFSRLQHPVFLSDTLRKTGPEFSVAVGIGLRMLER